MVKTKPMAKNKQISKQRPLTIKQRKFVEAVVETGNKAKAAKLAGYKCKDNRQAASVGYENMIKPYISAEIEDRLKNAKAMIYTIAMTGEKEDTRLRASQDIVDRNEGKALARTQLSGEVTILSESELGE